MPKQKTKKSITKRFKVTKKGKVIRRKAFIGHLKVNKSKKRKKNLQKVTSLKEPYAKKIKKALGVKKP
jgi:large subunit ribosomal protein L35